MACTAREDTLWYPTAALVVEIISPGDETWEKLPFYASHRVDEVLIVDPRERSVSWLALKDGEYRPIERSGLIDLGARGLLSSWTGRRSTGTRTRPDGHCCGVAVSAFCRSRRRAAREVALIGTEELSRARR